MTQTAQTCALFLCKTKNENYARTEPLPPHQKSQVLLELSVGALEKAVNMVLSLKNTAPQHVRR